MMADTIWLYGLSPNKWSQLVRMHPDEPVADPTLGLLLRFLDQHPDLPIIPRWSSPRETFDRLNAAQKLTQADFSLMMGFERSATTRWFKPSRARPSATLSRLMFCFKTQLLAMREEGRGQLIDDWRATAKLEAQKRGVEDLFATGRWTGDAANDEK